MPGGGDLTGVDAEFGRGQGVSRRVRQSQCKSVGRAAVYMDKLRRTPRKIDRRIVDADKFRSAVPDRLADLFGRKTLFFFGFAADQHDDLGVAYFLVRTEVNAQVGENRPEFAVLGDRKIVAADGLSGKSLERKDRFVGQTRAGDDADRLAGGLEFLGRKFNGLVPRRRDQLAAF